MLHTQHAIKCYQNASIIMIQNTQKESYTLRPYTKIKLITASSLKINLRFAILTQA